MLDFSESPEYYYAGLVTSTYRSRDCDISVTNTRGILPILLSADKRKQADALLFLDGEAVSARIVPSARLSAFLSEDAHLNFERKYGEIPKGSFAAIKAAISLIQAFKNPAPQNLKGYIAWQAAAEVKTEEDLASRVIQAFQPKFRKNLSGIRGAVRGSQEREHREEHAALQKRISSGGNLLSVSELLLQINRLVRRARFVMYMDRKQKKPLPGLYCPDPGTALAAMVFNLVPTPNGLGVCRSPSCGKSFLRVKAGQQYHSIACGNADRKARQRARERSK